MPLSRDSLAGVCRQTPAYQGGPGPEPPTPLACSSAHISPNAHPLVSVTAEINDFWLPIGSLFLRELSSQALRLIVFSVHFFPFSESLVLGTIHSHGPYDLQKK